MAITPRNVRYSNSLTICDCCGFVLMSKGIRLCCTVGKINDEARQMEALSMLRSARGYLYAQGSMSRVLKALNLILDAEILLLEELRTHLLIVVTPVGVTQ